MQHKFDTVGGDRNFQVNIYLCWLLAWCGTLKYQDDKEKVFLAYQAVKVLKKMVYSRDTLPSVEIFEIMMDTAFWHGNEKIVRFFFELYFEEFKLPPNHAIILFMLNAKGKGGSLANKRLLSLQQEARDFASNKLIKDKKQSILD